MLNLATHWPLQFGPFSVTGGSYTQAGSGDPSPANIRAITAWKAAGASTTVVRTGKNLIPFPYTHTTKTLNGITWTVNADGSVTSNGTASADSDFVFSGALAINPGTYMLSGCPAGGSTSTYFMYGANLLSTADTGDGSAAVVSVAPLAYTVFARVKSGTTISNKIFWPQIEKGSTKTAYEPYISKSATLAAPELYAGYMGDDWYWRRTWVLMSCTGAETVSVSYTGMPNWYYNIIPTAGAAISGTAHSAYISSSHYKNISILSGNENQGCDIVNAEIRVRYGTEDTAANFKAFLAAQAAAATPVTFCYQLATPVSIAPTIP